MSLQGMRSLIRPTQIEIGETSKETVIRALYELHNRFGVPIIIIPSEYGSMLDMRGIDVDVKGVAPFVLQRTGIDIKSSTTGAEEYLAEQQELEERGFRNTHRRFLFYFYNQPHSVLLMELLKFLLEKSESHHQIFVDRIEPESSHWVGPEFEANFRSLVQGEIFPPRKA